MALGLSALRDRQPSPPRRVLTGPRLRPVKEAGARAVHLLGVGGVALCGTMPLDKWRAVSAPSEHVCNACHAEACKLKGTIAWKPKETGGC